MNSLLGTKILSRHVFICLLYFIVGKWYWWLWKSWQNTSQGKEIWGSSDFCSTRGTRFLYTLTVFQRLSNNLQCKIYCIIKPMNLPLNLTSIFEQTANGGSFAWMRTFAHPGAATDYEFQTVKGVHEEYRWLKNRKHWLLLYEMFLRLLRKKWVFVEIEPQNTISDVVYSVEIKCFEGKFWRIYLIDEKCRQFRDLVYTQKFRCYFSKNIEPENIIYIFIVTEKEVALYQFVMCKC